MYKGFVQEYAGKAGPSVVRVIADASGSFSRQLYPYETYVEVDDALGISTIKLPPVEECEGRTFTIVALTGTADVTVAPYQASQSIDWDDPGALTAAKDRVSLYSDGRAWTIVDTDHTT